LPPFSSVFDISVSKACCSESNKSGSVIAGKAASAISFFDLFFFSNDIPSSFNLSTCSGVGGFPLCSSFFLFPLYYISCISIDYCYVCFLLSNFKR